MGQKHVIAVCEYGWILCGLADGEGNDAIFLKETAVVRKWRNGRGIGGLAKAKYKDEYTLDPVGGVVIQKSKILFEIPCEW